MSTLVSRGEKMSKIHESTQETGTKKISATQLTKENAFVVNLNCT